MKLFSFLSVLIISFSVSSQTVIDLKKRYDTYLNFNGSLNSLVSFNANSVSVLNAGKSEFTVFTDEQPTLSFLLKKLNPTDFLVIYKWKKNTHLSSKQLDSLKGTIQDITISASQFSSLKGKKIAIDPGHFAGNMEVARIEQKFIEFIPSPLNTLKDTIRFNEGVLTFQTAEILKQRLLEQGANVMVTRPKQNYTSFQITYDDWISKRKKPVLDSLLKENAIDKKRYTRLMNLGKDKLFWEFFRDYELMERVRIINEFKPDVTVIIHYNVDEKNTDWINPTKKNFTMTFIGGGITGDNFAKPINKVHFLRLLLTNQINESEKLASLTVNQFSKQMTIPIAQKNDADYLRDNCLKAPSNGVFCRNLALCRTINSPLVYGECLYQDNINECLNLNKADYEIYGQKLPKRIYEASNCYYNALNEYFSKP